MLASIRNVKTLFLIILQWLREVDELAIGYFHISIRIYGPNDYTKLGYLINSKHKYIKTVLLRMNASTMIIHIIIVKSHPLFELCYEVFMVPATILQLLQYYINSSFFIQLLLH